ncbi:alpha/beta fold hydrolase BchO [Pseudooctadecabacter jejudonensis]|uniref:Dihydrolipoyllysine-residue acetyltransferase component of acetoin cleaving system n=1 Tax=Pseudooctadecabacter jejudonensis TaxID=1391910 RepID=A0A1Y5S5E4_9RHOB|nr:alpha/beta fold hydrolase BchO [Pseudooctadecabacter jejudonensis]SLN32974.1 Dihydrolipoyllysine-residue acetyltransferase component of acetoin cleaving system [Pseudooctadecabacter jejudonensis]
MKWPEDATGWPMADHSRKVLCRPHRWHVQEAGTGDTLLLIHGAGGATQSWRGIFPILRETHHVVAVDLPGQGFSENGARARCGLAHMAEDLAALIQQEGWTPNALIGHSAGAAIALQMARSAPCHVIGINAALSNFKGVAGWLFPMMAKALALNPISAALFAKTTTPAGVRNLIAGTGSKLNAEGEGLYLRLAQDSGHVDATLSMMAQWSLDGLTAALPDIQSRVDLIIANGDKAVPPSSSRNAAHRLADAHLHEVTSLGHLAHEEDPKQIADVIYDVL